MAGPFGNDPIFPLFDNMDIIVKIFSEYGDPEKKYVFPRFLSSFYWAGQKNHILRKNPFPGTLLKCTLSKNRFWGCCQNRLISRDPAKNWGI